MAESQSSKLSVKDLGLHGVNVDKDPLELADGECRQLQNAIHEPLGNNAGLSNRPGLIAFNLTGLAGSVLGGIAVPLINLSESGTTLLYIGRAPTS
jgi:hypothetical protein